MSNDWPYDRLPTKADFRLTDELIEKVNSKVLAQYNRTNTGLMWAFFLGATMLAYVNIILAFVVFIVGPIWVVCKKSSITDSVPASVRDEYSRMQAYDRATKAFMARNPSRPINEQSEDAKHRAAQQEAGRRAEEEIRRRHAEARRAAEAKRRQEEQDRTRQSRAGSGGEYRHDGGAHDQGAPRGDDTPRDPRTKDERHYASVLGLQGQVTRDEVKRRYRELVTQYHPDKVNHLGPKLKTLAENEMKEINEAFDFFRKKYDIG